MQMLIFLLSSMIQSQPMPEQKGFAPITTGSIIQLGEFQLTVPNGVFLAPEDHAYMMMPLAGANNIPLCKGVFYSASATWDYGVAIQLIEGYKVSFQPIFPESFWSEQLKTQHFYVHQPYTGKVEVVEPAHFDQATNSLSIAVIYYEGEYAGYYKKSIFFSNQGALVLSAKAHLSAFESKKNEIDSCFASISLHPSATSTSESTDTLSYLQLLGLEQFSFIYKMTQAKNELNALPSNKTIYATTAALIFLSAGLLFFAYKKRRVKESSPHTEPS